MPIIQEFINDRLLKRNWHYTLNRRLQSKGLDLRRFPNEYQLAGFIPEVINLLNQVDPSDLSHLLLLFEGCVEIKQIDGKIHSQLGQEALVASLTRDVSNPFYLEIGAYHPYVYSNTAALRDSLSWDGISVDPSSATYSAFQAAGLLNRFRSVAVGPNSGITHFSERGALSSTSSSKSPGSTAVEMISIKELVSKLPSITYLSLDIEGGEFEILSAYPWDISRPLIITVEHNYDLKIKTAIYRELKQFRYKRILDSLSNFESWFVHSDIL